MQERVHKCTLYFKIAYKRVKGRRGIEGGMGGIRGGRGVREGLRRVKGGKGERG